MKGISLTRLVRRGWMVLVAVLVIAAAGFGVYRLHGAFGSHQSASAGYGVAEDIKPFNPKHITLEVFGDP
ncbi:MAG: MmpS family transport accessory protein, partial [Mycobacterium sp.]